MMGLNHQTMCQLAVCIILLVECYHICILAEKTSSHGGMKDLYQRYAGQQGQVRGDVFHKNYPKPTGGRPAGVNVRLSDASSPVLTSTETDGPRSFIVKISRGSIYTSNGEEDSKMESETGYKITQDMNTPNEVIQPTPSPVLNRTENTTGDFDGQLGRTSSLVVPPAPTASSRKIDTPKINSRQEKRNRRLRQEKKIRDLETEVKSLRYQQALVLGHYNKLYMNQRLLSREFRDLDNRNRRLLLFQTSEIQRLKWRQNNDTAELQAGLTFFRTLMICLNSPIEDEDCIGTAESSIKEALSQNNSMLEGIVSHTRDAFKARREKLEALTPERKSTNQDPSPSSHLMTSARDALLAASVRLLQDASPIQKPRDCSEIDLWTQRIESIQVVHLHNRSRPVTVLCEEGWLVIFIHPAKYSEQETIFTWNMYKYGYGSLVRDDQESPFWIGNAYLFQLTNQGNYRLRIEMRRSHDNYDVFSEYRFFRIRNESQGYSLQVSGPTGSAGDILGLFSSTPLTNQPFSCMDHISDKKQEMYVKTFHRGWWYPKVDEYTDDNSSYLPDGIVYDRPGLPGQPCFTHLTAKEPWFCELNNKVYVDHVKMMIRPDY